MATYSIGTPPTDATKLANLQSILNVLPDNTSKTIAPKDIRDSSYTLWENIIFKPTTNSGISGEYIGIDQDTFQEKILLGKKSVGGQYIMTNDLLSTDVDIFFYNTKVEPTTDYNTKVAFLAGTGSNYQGGYINAPYLQSTVVSGSGNTIDFEVMNPSYYMSGLTAVGGNINIKSDYGLITLNGLRLPTYGDMLSGSYDGYVLKYRFLGGAPYAVWENIASQSSVTSLISSGTVSISGSPVLLNGLDVNFTDSTPVPVAIGGILVGETFSSVPVTEMIRRIVYPYVAPVLTSNMSTSYIESGNTTAASALKFNYTIVKNSTYNISSLSVSPAYSGSLYTVPITTNSITATGYVTPNLSSSLTLAGTQSWNSNSWTITLGDTYPTSKTSTSTVKVVIPWYYGTSTTGGTSSAVINSILGTSSSSVANKLTPLLTEPAVSSSSTYNKTVTLSGSGVYVYFGYPADFPDLVSIIDPNGFNVFSSFKKYIIGTTLSPIYSPTTPPIWNGKSYKFYIYVGAGGNDPITTTIGVSSTYSGDYQFKFA
jgi:hypothetical protein